MSPFLLTPFRLRNLELRNRVVMSPMCQYSATDGLPNSWHQVHLGARAVGGVGAVIVEATAVVAEGRISPGCTGLWNQHQVEAFKPITSFVRTAGVAIGVQLAHAGRKASTPSPWDVGGSYLAPGDGGWIPSGPSAIAFGPGYAVPKELTLEEIRQIPESFSQAARRAREAGFDFVEIHAAHGYLLHEFLSPLSNERTDSYGGSFQNRSRLILEVARAVRSEWPSDLPVMIRLSATDWAEGGWDLESSIRISVALKECGIDLIDCSSGGAVPQVNIPVGPGYQVPFASAIRREAKIATGAVGLITEPKQAEAILVEAHADLIFLGRVLLRDPYWTLRAAQELGGEIAWPKQYDRAR